MIEIATKRPVEYKIFEDGKKIEVWLIDTETKEKVFFASEGINIINKPHALQYIDFLNDIPK